MANFPSPGDRFEDRFEILAHVASGGFSRIYRANQIGLDREVALKILRPSDGSDQGSDRERFEEWAQRFEREARLVSQLRDPHTVTVHDHGRTGDGLWFIVFEFIDGKTIAEERLDEPFEAERVVDILLQVLASLEEAHDHDVLHRDIKPANIMLYEHLGRSDRVKVLDFGIAQSTAADEDAAANLTRDGYILGTPRYMAPEQLRQGELTPASDIYSLGLVAWEMLANRPAIAGNDTMAIVTRQADAEGFPLPDDVDAPRWLCEVIERMVAKDPSERFQSARELREALENPTVQHTASALIDPNLSETEDAFGQERSSDPSLADPSIGAAVAALQEDRAKSAAATPPGTSARSARRKSVESVPGLEPEDGTARVGEGVESGVDKSDNHKGDESGTDAKVSELTMLGVEQMLRNSERDGGRRWRLGCAVVAVLALVVSGGLGVMLYRHAGSLATMPQAGVELVNQWVIYPVSDSLAPEDRFSIQGLQLAIESADWQPEGEASVVETTHSRKIMQTYTHKRQRVHAAFYDLSERSAARKLVDQTRAPARAVRCDTKVVVLEPATDADVNYVDGLILLLETYREVVIEAPAGWSL